MAFFISDARCSYYLFGANDPAMRETNASSKLLLDNIALSAHKGLKIFDFVGVNSPLRGDFKMSFNAELVPYQEVHLETYV
jgi:lipid II:glycine glycyltransferase (peptidoglycan interpeptide bridge formation enzyme)